MFGVSVCAHNALFSLRLISSVHIFFTHQCTWINGTIAIHTYHCGVYTVSNKPILRWRWSEKKRKRRKNTPNVNKHICWWNVTLWRTKWKMIFRRFFRRHTIRAADLFWAYEIRCIVYFDWRSRSIAMAFDFTSNQQNISLSKLRENEAFGW